MRLKQNSLSWREIQQCHVLIHEKEQRQILAVVAVLTEDARALLIEKSKASFTAQAEKTITTKTGKYCDSATVAVLNANATKCSIEAESTVFKITLSTDDIACGIDAAISGYADQLCFGIYS